MGHSTYDITKAKTTARAQGTSRRVGSPLPDNRLPTQLHGVLPDNRDSGEVIQRVEIPATVTGLTHLVAPKGNSIFEGEEAAEIGHGTTIVIENSDKIRSRRGPNQEHNRASDLGSDPVYRWVRVVKVGGKLLSGRVYIRDDTLTSLHAQALGPRPSKIAPGQRDRSGILPDQNVVLVGTTHSKASNHNKSARVEDNALLGSDLIVEHPTPSGRNNTTQDPGVQDITQENLINRAQETNAHIIGGDGRKLVDPTHRVHALSIRSQPQTIDLAPHADVTHISQLALEYVSACLGIGHFNIDGVIHAITQIGTYRSTSSGGITPDVAAVLQNGYQRVSTITKYFRPEVKMALAKKVIAVFRMNLQSSVEGIVENVEDLKAYYQQKNPEPEDKEIFERGLRDYAEKMDKVAVSPFHDAISNLTLFSEALASNKTNLVVAFGKEHVAPLKGLLNEVSGIHKNYNVDDKT